MGVRRRDWWCCPERCQNGHEWGPGLITVSWMLCDCPPDQAAREQVGAARRGTWPCSVTLRPAAGRCSTGPGASSGVNRRSAWRNRWRRRQSPETAPARRAHSPTRERCATTWHAPTRRLPIAHSFASGRAEGVRGSPAAGVGHGYSLRGQRCYRSRAGPSRRRAGIVSDPGPGYAW